MKDQGTDVVDGDFSKLEPKLVLEEIFESVSKEVRDEIGIPLDLQVC